MTRRRPFAASPSARTTVLIGLLLVVGSTADLRAQTAENEAPSPLTWTESTRDVYIDARAVPAARVWEAGPPERTAILLPDADEVLVLEEDGTIAALPRGSFTIEAPRLASSPDPEPQTTGSARGAWIEVADGGLLGSFGATSFLVQPHQGLAGDVDAAQIREADGSWPELGRQWAERLGTEGAEAETDAVARLAAVEAATELEVFFGTWCGDSRRSVPKLLEALEKADNPQIDLRLVALRSGFTEPLAAAIENRITNVPTVIVRQNGEEIGRLVETPLSESVVTDLAAMLSGTPLPAREEASSSDRPIAHGRYEIVDSSRATAASETWSLFRTGHGELRLFSVTNDGDGRTTEVRQRLKERGGESAFLEITRESAGETTRTRVVPRTEGLHFSLTRGNASGIVEQLHAPPEGSTVVAPGVAGFGVAWSPDPSDGRRGLLRFPAAGDGFAGRLATVDVEREVEPSTVEISGGVRSTVRLRLAAEEGGSEVWLDRELGIPLRLRFSDGSEARLVELHVD